MDAGDPVTEFAQVLENAGLVIQGLPQMDGAIHRAAGIELLSECARIGGCPPGEARSTGGYKLPAKHVIHTVGPIWRGGGKNEAETLAAAYKNSLNEALRLGAERVAFPAISTGVYRFPPAQAAAIAVKTVADFLAEHKEIKEVRLVCFSAESKKYHEEALAKISAD